MNELGSLEGQSENPLRYWRTTAANGALAESLEAHPNADFFTYDGMHAMQSAAGFAAQWQHREVLPEHILGQFADHRRYPADRIFSTLGIAPQSLQDDIRMKLGFSVDSKALFSPRGPHTPPLSKSVQELVAAAFKLATDNAIAFVASEHLLCATLQDKKMQQILSNLAADLHLITDLADRSLRDPLFDRTQIATTSDPGTGSVILKDSEIMASFQRLGGENATNLLHQFEPNILQALAPSLAINAWQAAWSLGHEAASSAHLLLYLGSDPKSLADRLMTRMRLSRTSAKEAIGNLLPAAQIRSEAEVTAMQARVFPGNRLPSPSKTDLFSPDFLHVTELAASLAGLLGMKTISIDLFVLAGLQCVQTSHLRSILETLSIDIPTLESHLVWGLLREAAKS